MTHACVDPIEAVRPLLGSRNIDLINIDIEGAEPAVLNCPPFDSLGVHAVLMETNKASVKQADLFFHRHGFVNEQTFLNHATGGPQDQDIGWLDNLYVRRAAPAKLSPASKFACSASHRQFRDRWCGPWVDWMPKKATKFGKCPVA